MGMDGYLWVVGGIEHLLERFCEKGERGDGETEREKFEALIYLPTKAEPKLNFCCAQTGSLFNFV